ncbi:MAG: amidohydrolase [Clostridiales bacterium]|jgi:predicted TIM-barrel fold metal-dependent hydrolase|nr:amidohydrolase [Clostridiales bacterium]
MRLIDCSACIGYGGVNRRIVNHENYTVTERVDEPKDAGALLAEMDFCGIDAAVVYHQAMLDVSPAYGNDLILKETAGRERLYASVALLPPVSDEGFGVPDLRRVFSDKKVVAARMYPKINRFMLNRVTVGEVLEYMTEARIPLFLSPSDGWEDIFGVLKEFPDLTAVITNYGLWGSDRYFYPLARAYKNVHIDTGDFQEIRGVEAFVRQFGSGRLLFGTNYPMDNMGGPVAVLAGARISEADRENIACKNIERLIAEVKR